jgi:hypothetical protein
MVVNTVLEEEVGVCEEEVGVLEEEGGVLKGVGCSIPGWKGFLLMESLFEGLKILRILRSLRRFGWCT